MIAGVGVAVAPGVSHVRITGAGRIDHFHIGVRAQSSHHIEVLKIVENQVLNCMGYGTGIRAVGGDDHYLEMNFIKGCDSGITLSGTSRVHVTDNERPLPS